MPLTRPLQMGHFLNDGAHSLHTTRCPHGMKTMFTSLSIHTLQVRSSCRRRSCSSMGRSENGFKNSVISMFIFWSLKTYWCVIAPERSWLGDEASLDWAKNVNLNMVLDHSSA